MSNSTTLTATTIKALQLPDGDLLLAVYGKSAVIKTMYDIGHWGFDEVLEIYGLDLNTMDLSGLYK